jgi:hypothetical protein
MSCMVQGNAGFYTESALKERTGAWSSLELKDAVKRWWDWLPRSWRNPSSGALEVSKPVYCAMVVIIQLVRSGEAVG